MKTDTNIVFHSDKIYIRFNLCNFAPIRTSHSFASETCLSSLPDIPISRGQSLGFETSFLVHSHPRPTHSNGDQESVSSLSATSTGGLPCQMMDEKIRPPTHDSYHYPLRLEN